VQVIAELDVDLHIRDKMCLIRPLKRSMRPFVRGCGVEHLDAFAVRPRDRLGSCETSAVVDDRFVRLAGTVSQPLEECNNSYLAGVPGPLGLGPAGSIVNGGNDMVASYQASEVDGPTV